MGKILDFFRRHEPVDRPPARDARPLVESLYLPAIHLVATDGASPSYIGGAPCLPQIVDWPHKNHRALTFLACLDLRSLADAGDFSWLPGAGQLLFFYDNEEQPWGFDPGDAGSWRVIYLSEAGGGTETASPVSGFRQKFLAPTSIRTLPGWDRETIAQLELSDEESDAYDELSIAQYGDAPVHQVGGYPRAVQGDGMELECQLVSNGLSCGDAAAYNDPRTGALTPGADNWQLLLQIDTDDDLDMMWGDCGTLYFWIRQDDALALDFDRVWTILQCC